MKDIAQNDKLELAQTQRVNKVSNQQLSDVATERNKIQERLQIAESQIDELKEQVKHFFILLDNFYIRMPHPF